MTIEVSSESLEERNRQLIAEFMEVFGRGNVEDILAYMSDNATWWVAGTMDGISGTKDKQAFGEMLGGISANVKGGIQLKPLAWTCQGERVAVETESYAELNNGRVYNNLYHFVFVVKGGRIERVKEFLDTEHTTAIFLAP